MIGLLLKFAAIAANVFFFLLRRPVRVDRFYAAFDWQVRTGSGRKRALVSHRAGPVVWTENDPRFLGHSIDWEARQIVRTICGKGYEAHVLNAWSPLVSRMNPGQGFDLILDENANLPALMAHLSKDCIRILYLTGSYPRFQNAEEWKRMQALRERRGTAYYPRRQLKADLFDISLELAHKCVLVGNDVTLATYPEKFRNKIVKNTVSASETWRKKPEEYVPAERGFLWFFGEGAVHKGLDLLLEVFSRRRDLTLRIAGSVQRETDFMRIYAKELALPNIHLHGFVTPTSEKFRCIIQSCFAFIAPSCSEGISPAVVTCLQAGLFPLISPQTGVSLPDNAGMYLKTCSLEEIEAAMDAARALSDSVLGETIAVLQKSALENYSRERYASDMQSFFDSVEGI